MLVFVNNKLYDDSETPIILVLSPQDRLDIIAMPPKDNLMYTIPEGMTEKDRLDFFKRYDKAMREKAENEGDKKESPPSSD